MSKQLPDLHLGPDDFKVDWYSGSGAGGQHRNKHRNCCRITHIETGLCATGARSRSRVENQRNAFSALAQRLLAHYAVPSERRTTATVIRTYHGARNIVRDHASGVTREYRKVLDDTSSFGDLIEARAQSMGTKA